MATELDTVLVGTSLDEASDTALETADAIARALDARLHVVHAFPMPAAYLAAPRALGGLYKGLLDVERETRRERLRIQLERLGIRSGRETETTVVAGAPHRALADQARQHDIGLIVVGASEKAGSLGLGSVADRVLRQAVAPVLAVRGTLKIPPTKVLAPVDLSRISTASLDRGLALIDALPDAAPVVQLLHVLPSDDAVTPDSVDPEQLAQAVAAELQALAKRLAPKGRFRFETPLEIGGPRRGILAHLAADPADLVILGSHGHGGFVRLLIGSVAEAIARDAPTSVLLVPPGEPDDGADAGAAASS